MISPHHMAMLGFTAAFMVFTLGAAVVALVYFHRRLSGGPGSCTIG